MTDETKGDGMTLAQVRDVLKNIYSRGLICEIDRTLIEGLANSITDHLATKSAMRSVRERNGDEYLVESARFDPDHTASPLFNDVRAYEVTHPDGRVQLIPNDPEMVEILKQSGRQVVPLQSEMRVDEAMVERAMDAARSVNRGLLTVAGMRAALLAATGWKE